MIKKNKKSKKDPILHLSLNQSLKVILTISFWIFFVIAFYVGVTTLTHTQPITKMYSKMSGYHHYNDNKDLVNMHNTFGYMNLYLGMSSHKFYYTNYTFTKHIYSMTEDEFLGYIKFLKGIDKLRMDKVDSPCQLYSYLWSEYYDYNNVDYKYHYTTDHTFLVVDRSFGYSIVDQDSVYNVLLG